MTPSAAARLLLASDVLFQSSPHVCRCSLTETKQTTAELKRKSIDRSPQALWSTENRL